jgi:integrase/recombinase XerD
MLWLQEAGRHTDLNALTRKDVEDYLEHCFYRGNTNETRLTKLVALGRFFRYLVYEGKINTDVTAQVPRPKLKRKFVQKFTKQEVLRFFTAIDITREKGLRDACIMLLAVFGGLRAGEIAGLTLQDLIDEGSGSLDIHLVGKFGSERQIYLWKAPSDLLRRWFAVRLSQGARAAAPLFTSYRRGCHHRGNRLTIVSLDTLVKTYARLAGVQKPKISMHMFRATHASDLRSIEGYDTPAIAERLGHRSIATTDRYFPTRGRIHKTYASLAAYWREFTTLWKEEKDIY